MPYSMAYGIGVSVPTLAAAAAKSVGSIIAFGSMDFIESITAGRTLKIHEKISHVQNAAIIMPNANPVEIKDNEQSAAALTVTAMLFLGVIAWNIKNSKKVQPTDLTDKQVIEAEKA